MKVIAQPSRQSARVVSLLGRLAPKRHINDHMIEISPFQIHLKEWQGNVLRLLDNLQCPLLVMPLVKKGIPVKRIGLLTDLRYTDETTIQMLLNIATSFGASVTIFNIPAADMVKMEPGYAEKYFLEQIRNNPGIPCSLVNLGSGAGPTAIRSELQKENIDMVAAVRQRKNILYCLLAEERLNS